MNCKNEGCIYWVDLKTGIGNSMCIYCNGRVEPLSDHAVLSEVGELLPCPFCGSSDLESAKYIISYYIQCNDCQAVSPKCGTLEDLHLAWNKRANF